MTVVKPIAQTGRQVRTGRVSPRGPGGHPPDGALVGPGPEDLAVRVELHRGVAVGGALLRRLAHARERGQVVEGPRRVGGGRDEVLVGGVGGDADHLLRVVAQHGEAAAKCGGGIKILSNIL